MGFFKSLMSVISTDGKTGSPFKVSENHTVYYKGKGVTAVDAAHVGGFYQGYGYFLDISQSDIQITSEKEGAPVHINYIVGNGAKRSPEVETFYKGAAEGLQKLFPNRQISLNMVSTSLEHFRTL